MGRTTDPFKYFYYNSLSKKDIGLTGIDPGFLRQLWDGQGGRCAFTGLPMVLPDVPVDRGQSVEFRQSDNLLFAGSLDRKNSDLPYARDNVHFVCRFVNLGKGKSPDGQVMEFLEAYKERILAEALTPVVDSSEPVTNFVTD
jgi:hypothetical protein